MKLVLFQLPEKHHSFFLLPMTSSCCYFHLCSYTHTYIFNKSLQVDVLSKYMNYPIGFILLLVLQIVSPLVKVGELHSQGSGQTYFYVFEYQSKISDYTQVSDDHNQIIPFPLFMLVSCVFLDTFFRLCVLYIMHVVCTRMQQYTVYLPL